MTIFEEKNVPKVLKLNLPEDAEVPGHERRHAVGRELEDLGVRVQAGEHARLGQTGVPHELVAQDAVENLCRRRLHLGRRPPHPQRVAVAHLLVCQVHLRTHKSKYH
jgi:hypothetical protein